MDYDRNPTLDNLNHGPERSLRKIASYEYLIRWVPPMDIVNEIDIRNLCRPINFPVTKSR